jgi:hypothetical protein
MPRSSRLSRQQRFIEHHHSQAADGSPYSRPHRQSTPYARTRRSEAPAYDISARLKSALAIPFALSIYSVKSEDIEALKNYAVAPTRGLAERGNGDIAKQHFRLNEDLAMLYIKAIAQLMRIVWLFGMYSTVAHKSGSMFSSFGFYGP